MSDCSKINLDYSTSKWCKGVTGDQAISLHIETVKSKSDSARQNLENKFVNYVDNQPTEENCYNYFPSGNSTKLVIYIHGGFWQRLDVRSSSFLAEFWVGKGYNFVATGYDRCPTVNLSTVIRQTILCLQTIIRNENITEITLIGHSAGAHLALIAIVFDDNSDKLLDDYERALIKKLILVSGIYDVRPVSLTDNNDALKLTNEIAWELSPLRCLEDYNWHKSTKIFILVGEYESPAFKEQSKNLFDKLTAKNCSVSYRVVENKNHFDIMHDIGNEDYEITNEFYKFVIID